MSFSKVTRHGQVTIPKSLRKELHLEEGDYVEVIQKPEGILLLPKKVQLIDPEQAYYWTATWQERERQADADIRAGRVTLLQSLDDLDR